MKEISQFIPKLSSVCKIYSGVISGSGIPCEDALTLVAFINSFPSVHDVESGIMDLVLKAPTERMEIVLKSLHTDLDRIVELYKDNSIYYDRKDLRFLWDKPLSYADKDIEVQQKKTQAASDELKEASNSYEMTPFNGMSQDEAAVLERRVDKLTAEYQKEKAKLQNFYSKRKRLQEDRWSVPTDIFRLIYLKCHDLLPVVEKYYNKPAEKNKEQSEQRTDLYLSMSLLASVHELCNGRQFEDMTAIDFFHALNLHQISKPLGVCKNEKVRVCYLIHQLSEKIDKGMRSEWIGAMFRTTGIEQDYYRSKYREPISDPPSKKNKEFAEALKEILG
ncbi:MAG: hypothetical protein K2K98_01600 [Muribaculaceae bacterium]|nr:hypothetical protein [Muribaculaceae bacterium]